MALPTHRRILVEQLRGAWPRIQAIDPRVFTERFRRVWTYYLSGVIEGFRPGGGNLNLHHITFTKGKGNYPKDRSFIYVQR